MNDPTAVITHPDLAETAPLGLALSQVHCTDACRDYHAVWGFLRLYGVLISVSRHREFLRDMTADAVRNGARRALVSGSADFGILSCVAEGFDVEKVAGAFTVVDLCATSLGVNEWFAARHGLALATSKGSILDYDGGPFDLIVAHNFLGFLDTDDRVTLFHRWAAMLAPGGRVIVVNRVKPDAPDTARRFGDKGAEDLLARILAAREGHPHADLIDTPQLSALVTGYARDRKSYNIRTEDALRKLFTDAGLQIERWDTLNRDKNHARYGDHGGPVIGVVARKT